MRLPKLFRLTRFALAVSVAFAMLAPASLRADTLGAGVSGQYSTVINFDRADYYVSERFESKGTSLACIGRLQTAIFFDNAAPFAPTSSGSFNTDTSAGSDFATKFAHMKSGLQPGARMTLGLFSLTPIAGNATATQAFINNLTTIFQQYGFTGVDLDWEDTTPSNANYSTTVQKIVAWAHDPSRNYVVSISNGSWAAAYATRDGMVAPYVDFENIQFYHSTTNSESVGDVAWGLTQFINAGVPASKIRIGLPTYGMVNTSVTSTSDEWRDWSALVAAGVNVTTGTSWTDPSNSQTYYFSGLNLLQAKINYAKTNGFAGVFTWELTDDVSYTNPLSANAWIDNNALNTPPVLTFNDSNYSPGATLGTGMVSLGNGGVLDNGILQFSLSSNNTFANPITGTGAVQQIGPGSTTLSGTNSYTGGTLITNGTLTFANANSDPGGAGSIVISGSGSLVAAGAQTTVMGWLNSGQIAANPNGSIAIRGNSSEAINFTGYDNLGLSSLANATYSGTITPGANGYLFGGSNPNATLTVSSALGGTNSLTMNGLGTLALAGADSYTGATIVNRGTLSLVGTLTSPLTINSGAVLTGSGSTSGSVTLNDGATLLVNGGILTANGVIASKTTNGVAIVTPAISGSNSIGIINYGAGADPALANFNVSGYRSGTLTDDTVNHQINLAFTTNTDVWNVTSGNWNLGVNTNWSNGGDSLFYNGDAAIFNNPTAASTITLTANVAPGSITVGNSTNAYTFSGTGAIIGGGTLTKTGTGELDINNANSFSGGTTVSGGMIRINTDSALGTGAITVSGNSTLANANNAGARNLANNIAINSGITASFDSGYANVTISGAITSAGNLSTASVVGTTILNGNNSYAGTTNIVAGTTLQIGADGTAGSLGTGAVTNSGTLAFNRSDSISVANAISGTGVLVQNGAGTITLSGNSSSYTGATSVTTGTLAVSGTVNGTSSIAISRGGQLSVLSGGSLTTTGQLSTAAGSPAMLNIAAGGVMTAGSTNDTWGDNMVVNGTLNAGTLSITNGSTKTIFGTGTINTNQLNFGNYTIETISVANLKIGSGGIVNSPASGTLSFGATTVSATASWNSTANLGLLSASGASTTFNTTGGNIGLSGVLSGTGALTAAGTGTLTLSGTNIYSGSTTVSGGILRTGNAKALGTGAVAISGGTLQVGNGTANTLTGVGTLTLNNTNSVLDLKTNTGSITLASGANFTMTGGTWKLSSATSNQITFNGGTYNLTGGTIDLSGFAGATTTGTYHILNGSGTSALINANFTGGNTSQFNYWFDTAGDLVVAPLTAFNTWQQQYFGGNANNPAIAGPTANPAGDGISNLMKFALNISPLTSGVSQLPTGTVSSSGSNYVFTYRQNDAATGVTYTVEQSTDLQTWTPITVTPVQISDDGTTSVMQVTVPMNGQPTLMLHLKVTQN